MSCMNCSDGDVVVLISQREEQKIWSSWRSWHAKTTLCNCPHLCGYPARPGSNAGNYLDVPEDTDIYMPMVSRLAQLP